MKKNRTLIVGLLLIVALALGIGYADLTSRLVFRGSANIDADPSNFKLEFVKVEDDDAENDYGTIVSANEATFTVSHLDVIGETSTFTYTIKNTSPGQFKAYLDQVPTVEAALLVADADDSNLNLKDYYEITVVIGAIELEYNAETTVKVTVQCIKSIEEDVTLTYRFHIEGHSDETMVKKANP